MLDHRAPSRPESLRTRPELPRAALTPISPGDTAPLDPIHVIAPAARAPIQVPVLWEALVTDGHVRAARLRRMQPWIVGLGIVLLWLGFWIASRAPAVRHEKSAQMIVQERIVKAHQRAEAALAALPRLAPGAPAAGQLPPLAEVAGVVQQTLQSLDKSGDLPGGAIDFVETDRNALWKGDWTAERVHYARSGDVVLVAATVNAGVPARVQPARWMGAFKKFGERWQYCSLLGAGLMAPRDFPAVPPSQIAMSLAPLLPDEH